MTKLIRGGIFETNSSSTHALVVPHKVNEENYSLNDSLWHEYGFGRQESRLVEDWDEKLAYLYAVVRDTETTKEMVEDFKKRVNMLWRQVYASVKYKPYSKDPIPDDIFKYIEKDGKYAVDHTESLVNNEKFLDKVFNDDEFLKRFLFNKDSYITIGGDEYRGYNIKTIGFEYDYDDGDHRMNENGELPPKEWLNERGGIKDEYWDRYWDEYTLETGEFWNKLREYEKDNDVFLKGN